MKLVKSQYNANDEYIEVFVNETSKTVYIIKDHHYCVDEQYYNTEVGKHECISMMCYKANKY